MKVSAPPRPSRDRQLLEAIARAHSEFIASGDFRKIFEGLLEILLELTNSEYGFIGQVLSQNGSRPYLKMYAITNISWNPDTRKLYEEAAADGLEFHNLQTLFGHALTTGEAVIANKPSADPRSGGVPKGHPPLNAFLGLPIKLGDSMVGMAGVANRPEGYDRDLIDFLEPFLLTCGSLISTIRSSEKREVVEAALRSSELRTRAVLESTLDAIITSNEDGIIESVNPATERMFGYEAEDLIGRNVSVLMPQPSAGEHDESIRHYLQTGAPNIIGIGREVTGLRKDGSTFPINLSITEVDLPGHRLFTGIIRDISDRKEAEAQLEKTLAELESSHDDLLAILNETEMGIVMVDENGRISFMSRSCAEMLEMNQENFIGTAWQEVCPFTAEQKRRLQEMFDADVSARERLSAQLHLPDGTESWAEVEVRDDPRDPAGKIFFLYDVTEVHRLRSRLNTVSQTQMVGKSPDMQKMFGIFDKIAPGDWTVLIEGETGVGKELVAQGLHAASPRREGPFIAVNCAGLTDSLLTSQLFGHRRGAFTGAVRDQEGLFEAATKPRSSECCRKRS
jgi:PAS domain S-box-containing protein